MSAVGRVVPLDSTLLWRERVPCASCQYCGTLTYKRTLHSEEAVNHLSGHSANEAAEGWHTTANDYHTITAANVGASQKEMLRQTRESWYWTPGFEQSSRMPEGSLV